MTRLERRLWFARLVYVGLMVVALVRCVGGTVEATVTPVPPQTPTPTCIPMSREDWQEMHEKEAERHLLAYQIYESAAGGPMDTFGTYGFMADMELMAMVNAENSARDFSGLCGGESEIETPTPGK